MTDIAFLGLGIMGSGMVRNLLKAGHEVTVWNRTSRPLPADLAGASRATSIAEALAGKTRIFVCLTGPDAQAKVLEGPDGALAAAASDAIVVDATTTDPEVTRRLARAASEEGLRYLDCPVFGSRNEAWEGRLDFVCGGDREAFDAVRPLLDAMAASVHYMGESTAGTAMKLVGNLLVAAQMMSLGEGLSLARKAGLDAERVMGVLDVTDFSSGLIRGVGRASLAGDYQPHFYLKHMLKDARLIGDFARGLDVPLPASGVIAQMYQAAVNQGLGELNASGLHKMLFAMSGLDDKGEGEKSGEK